MDKDGLVKQKNLIGGTDYNLRENITIIKD